MIYRAVDDEDLMGEARMVAERLAAGATQALGLIKRALAASPGKEWMPSSTSSATARQAGLGDEFRKAYAPFWRSGRRISAASPARDTRGAPGCL